MTLSFFDFHSRGSRSESARSSPTKAKSKAPTRRFSFFRDPFTSGGLHLLLFISHAKDSAAEAEPKQQERVLGRQMGRRSSNSSLAVSWSAVTVLQGTAACAGSAKDAAADAASKQQGRMLGRQMGRRSSNGRTARLRRGKTGVAGAVRLQLSFHPVSPTPQPYRCAGLLSLASTRFWDVACLHLSGGA